MRLLAATVANFVCELQRAFLLITSTRAALKATQANISLSEPPLSL